MKKETIKDSAFFIGAFGAFASLRRISKFVRPAHHNPLVDLAIIGVEAILSIYAGGACSLAADAVIARYEKRKEEKKEEKVEEEDFGDDFYECEPEDPEDGIHFTVINTEDENKTPESSESMAKGSEVDGDI